MRLGPARFLHFTLIRAALSLPHMSLCFMRIHGRREMHPNGAEEDAVCIFKVALAREPGNRSGLRCKEKKNGDNKSRFLNSIKNKR